MGHHDTTSISSPSIAEVLDQFLRDQEQRLAPRTYQQYENVIRLLRQCLNNYAYNRLSKAESVLFERHYQANGDGHREFCKIFGPKHILPNVDQFLNYFMVRKVIAGRALLRAAGTVTKKLAKWMAQRGYADADEAENAVEQGGAAARNLPKADELAALLHDLAEDQGQESVDEKIDGYFVISRVSPGHIWLEGYLDGQKVGPISVPEEISGRCKCGWTISGVVARAGKEWFLLEAWNVYS